MDEVVAQFVAGHDVERVEEPSFHGDVLACAAFEMLSGQPPFPRDHGMAVIYAHASEPPPALTSRCPGLPPTVDAVFARTLAKDPADRYGSCQEFGESLREALELGPYDVEPASSREERSSTVVVPQVAASRAEDVTTEELMAGFVVGLWRGRTSATSAALDDKTLTSAARDGGHPAQLADAKGPAESFAKVSASHAAPEDSRAPERPAAPDDPRERAPQVGEQAAAGKPNYRNHWRCPGGRRRRRGWLLP